ncbi:MAG TPA: phospholipase C, phosphocholine-specific [Bryobacteraceae bacterium]|nr:phospholipase C, phosphocholine-specific [Bryobacteraceae bacterium]
MADHNRTRRQFFLDAARFSGSAALTAALLSSVEKAAVIDAEPGSTWLDAEHVVILMQENRSFDHAFGMLRGVRGFNDPRAITQPNGHPVWLQTNAAGDTYAPFHLDIQKTNITWLGSLPHSWSNQTDARNHGDHNGWLDAKPSGRPECAGMPLTMGHYDRGDLPFYYALADAFTICDQNFCSSLTGTTPNRLYLWTGTIRTSQDAASQAMVRNSDVDYGAEARWTTFPERLEDAGISWRIYQNEVSVSSGLVGEEDAWLANFTDNPIEWFEQYRVRFSKTHRAWANKITSMLPEEITWPDAKTAAAKYREAQDTSGKYTDEAWAKLSPRDRSLHERAFTTNASDPSYRELTTLRYRDGNTERELKVPKGDVLYQFREDVKSGKLPTVSWIVPPENFSDHPGAPWYGAWMVSEVMNILTHNPEIWKKTIFVLAYDENDGYFDHVAPFGAPDPSRPETGKVGDGIDAALEYWSLARDKEHAKPQDARGNSIGLGFRVPLVIASPWSRGGYVCSQVFDHTSVVQLLENLLSHKTGKQIRETNITAWRRAVCGDLSSAFQPASAAAQAAKLAFPARDEVIEGIHKAKFRAMPSGYRKLSAADVAQYRSFLPKQEAGTRRSLPLPYELHASGRLSADGKSLEISMEARKGAGSAFHVYAPGKSGSRAYAMKAGQKVSDAIPIENGAYRICICGPNGFLRELAGGADDPLLDVDCEYRPSGDLDLLLTNRDAKQSHDARIVDHSYGAGARNVSLKAGEKRTITLRLAKSHSWYDFSVLAGRFERRCAGRVETGKPGYSDPAMSNHA